MVATMCEFYGWYPEYCLKMPAIRFFAMHRTAAKIYRNKYNRQMLDLCHIAVLPNATQDYMNKIIKGFESRLDEYKDSSETVDGAGKDISLEVTYSALAQAFGMYRRSIGV